jgi:hypothetical protein
MGVRRDAAAGAPSRRRVVVAGGASGNELGVEDVGGRRQPSLAIGGGWGQGQQGWCLGHGRLVDGAGGASDVEGEGGGRAEAGRRSD